MTGFVAVLVTPLEQQTHRRHAHLVSRLVDRGEVDVSEPCEGDVVVSHEGHVLGDPEAVVHQRVEGADRGEVVADEDRGDAASIAARGWSRRRVRLPP